MIIINGDSHTKRGADKMGFDLKLKIDGETVINKLLQNCSDLPKDLSEVFKRVRVIVQEAIKQNFEEVGRGQGPWAALKPSTLADREAKGFGPEPIGGRTGEMFMSLTGDGDNTINEIGSDHAAFGAIGIKVKSFHRGKFNQESRPVLYLDEADKKAIVYEFRKEIRNKLTRNAADFFGGR
jgi:phage gpG-like protein